MERAVHPPAHHTGPTTHSRFKRLVLLRLRKPASGQERREGRKGFEGQCMMGVLQTMNGWMNDDERESSGSRENAWEKLLQRRRRRRRSCRDGGGSVCKTSAKLSCGPGSPNQRGGVSLLPAPSRLTMEDATPTPPAAL